METKSYKIISITVFLIFAVMFLAWFSGPHILKAYIISDMGGCQKLPLLCALPQTQILNPVVSREYLLGLVRYKFPKMEICLPAGFNVVNEAVKKFYYKRGIRRDTGPVIYLAYAKPNFFMDLFPQLKKRGVKDDYEFVKRTMYANVGSIKNLTDAFFVIMKGIFTPNLGDQKNLNMVQIRIADKKGFINYNLAATANYFDCTLISNEGDIFKVYIKDEGAQLDLDKVSTIVSTAKRI